MWWGKDKLQTEPEEPQDASPTELVAWLVKDLEWLRAKAAAMAAQLKIIRDPKNRVEFLYVRVKDGCSERHEQLNLQQWPEPVREAIFLHLEQERRRLVRRATTQAKRLRSMLGGSSGENS